jgi:hypothetical protein
MILGTIPLAFVVKEIVLDIIKDRRPDNVVSLDDRRKNGKI